MNVPPCTPTVVFANIDRFAKQLPPPLPGPWKKLVIIGVAEVFILCKPVGTVPHPVALVVIFHHQKIFVGSAEELFE